MATSTRAPSCRASCATADDVPAACPIGRSTPGTHGHSRTTRYIAHLRTGRLTRCAYRPLSNSSCLLRLTQDHHRLYGRMQQDIILRGPRPDVRWPIPPRQAVSVPRSPQHTWAKVVSGEPAMALRALARSHPPHIDVNSDHPDTVPIPERGDGRLAHQRRLPVQAVQHLAEDGTGLGSARCLDGKSHRQRPAWLPLGRSHSARGLGRDFCAHGHLRHASWIAAYRRLGRVRRHGNHARSHVDKRCPAETTGRKASTA